MGREKINGRGGEAGSSAGRGVRPFDTPLRERLLRIKMRNAEGKARPKTTADGGEA